MTLPDGTVMPGEGSFLEVVPMSRIAFTDMFTAGWQPTESGFFAGVFDLLPEGRGTRYHVRALHKTPEPEHRLHTDKTAPGNGIAPLPGVF